MRSLPSAAHNTTLAQSERPATRLIGDQSRPLVRSEPLVVVAIEAGSSDSLKPSYRHSLRSQNVIYEGSPLAG